MPKLTRRHKGLLKGVAIGAGIGALLCVAFTAGLLSTLQLQSGDFFFKAINADQESSMADRIVVVAIDDDSLNQLGHFPSWPRTYHADLVDLLAEAEARTVVFDILFSEPAQGDEQFAASLERAGNVILPAVYSTTALGHVAVGEPVEPAGFIRPVSILEHNALALGHANLLPDADGVVRRTPLVIQSGGESEPALALAAVAKYLRRPQVIESPVEDNRMYLAGRSIPVNDASAMIVNYLGPSAALGTAFQTVSFADALSGQVDPAIFQDRIVVIGATASALGDYFWTPEGHMMNGVEIHANAIHTILAGRFVAPATTAITVLSIMLLAILCSLVVLRLRVLWATLATILIGTIYLLSAFTLFDSGTMLNMVYPPLAIVGSFIGVTLFNIASERAEKHRITKTFGRYTSPEIVPEILDALDRGELTLEGQQKDATVLFADVRGFTGIAESMPPQELVRSLNAHLSVVIETVLQHHGMVNKFGGDGIMALWNVPARCEQHALQATRAAMAAQSALEHLERSDPTLTEMTLGMGICTGKVVAGNLGTEDRLEYSVIGDCANVAAKLTSAAEGGKVWIASDTYQLIKDQVEAEPLKPLTVKGKKEPVQAYEVCALALDAS